MHGLGLCAKADSYVAHMFYAWSFSHNTSVSISKKNNKYLLSLNTNNTLFYWGSGNYNVNIFELSYFEIIYIINLIN